MKKHDLPETALPRLASFSPPIRALVFGSSGGLGRVITDLLRAQPAVGEVTGGEVTGGEVYAASRANEDPWGFSFDDESSIARVVAAATAQHGLDVGRELDRLADLLRQIRLGESLQRDDDLRFGFPQDRRDFLGRSATGLSAVALASLLHRDGLLAGEPPRCPPSLSSREHVLPPWSPADSF